MAGTGVLAYSLNFNIDVSSSCLVVCHQRGLVLKLRSSPNYELVTSDFYADRIIIPSNTADAHADFQLHLP